MSEREDVERISSRSDGHWLVFDNERRVTGCHCGFEADVDSDCGWGDSVVDHIYAAGRVSERARLAGEVEALARVDALADEWQTELDTGAIRDSAARYCWSTAARELRAADWLHVDVPEGDPQTVNVQVTPRRPCGDSNPQPMD
jgi:hypothetical protein